MDNATFRAAESHLFREEGRWYLFHSRSCRARILTDAELAIWDAFQTPHPASLVNRQHMRFGQTDRAALDQLVADGFLQPVGVPEEPEPKPPKANAFHRLSLNVAHTCNMQCRYCLAGGGTFGGGPAFMDPEVAFRSVDFLLNHSNGWAEIYFFGGEPFLNPGLIARVITYAREKFSQTGRKIKFATLTNGTVWSRQLEALVRESTMEVGVSIDGLPKVHDSLRPSAINRGTHSRVARNVHRMLEAGISPRARVTLTSLNLSYFESYQHLLDMGFRTVRADPVCRGGEGLDLNPDDFERLCDEYTLIARDLLRRWEARDPAMVGEIFDKVIRIWRGQACTNACEAGTGHLGVSSDGKLYPCYAFPGEQAFALGNVDEGVTPHLHAAFMKGLPVTERHPCSDCWARYLCTGECYYYSWRTTGSSKGVSGELCRLRRRICELAIVLSQLLPESARIQAYVFELGRFNIQKATGG